MGTSRTTTPKPPDPRDQFEVLRSKLVADVVIAALKRYASDIRGDEDQEFAAPHSAILDAHAQELADWHAPNPSQAEQNGAY